MAQVADDLEARLVGLLLRGLDGRRPALEKDPRLQEDPHWQDQLWFYEYSHGDTGAGLGASHQTRWTDLVAEILLHR